MTGTNVAKAVALLLLLVEVGVTEMDCNGPWCASIVVTSMKVESALTGSKGGDREEAEVFDSCC